MESTPKLAILETLREMDNIQAEKVLDFIRSLPKPKSLYSTDYRRFKQQALNEIQLALNRDKSLSI